jgi:hypothetical protein
MKVASFGTLGRNGSATRRHWTLAASASSWAKAVAMKAETTRLPLLPAWARGLIARYRLRLIEREAHKMHPAALPGGRQHLRDRRLDALVGVGNDQLHPAQAAPGQFAQEAGPERLSLRRADIEAEDSAPPVRYGATG